MNIGRILALTLAAWMSCSMMVSAADVNGDSTPDPDVCVKVIPEELLRADRERNTNSTSSKAAAEQPVDYIKIDTKGLSPENVKIVTGERHFNFYAGDKLLLPHEGSFVTIADGDRTRRKAVLAMNTAANQAMVDKHPQADMVFLNGNGGALGKGATMHIAAGGRKYLYRFVALDHSLRGEWDLSSTYNAEQDAFVFPVETLDTYILSDADLNDERETNVSWLPNDMVNSKANQVADDLKARYKNDFALVSYGTKLEKMGRTVTFKMQTWGEVPSRLDPTRLRVYAYNEKTGKRLRMPDARPAYNSRTKSYRFTSDFRGMFVITDSAWVIK